MKASRVARQESRLSKPSPRVSFRVGVYRIRETHNVRGREDDQHVGVTRCDIYHQLRTVCWVCEGGWGGLGESVEAVEVD